MFPSDDDKDIWKLLQEFHKQPITIIKYEPEIELLTENEDVHLCIGNIDSLIDLALATGDKEWFMELTNKRAAMAHGRKWN
jgi:hypothetical protein